MNFTIFIRKSTDNLWRVSILWDDFDKDTKPRLGSATECEQFIKEMTGNDITISTLWDELTIRKSTDNLWRVSILWDDFDKDTESRLGSAAECEQFIKEVTGNDTKLTL